MPPRDYKERQPSNPVDSAAPIKTVPTTRAVTKPAPGRRTSHPRARTAASATTP